MWPTMLILACVRERLQTISGFSNVLVNLLNLAGVFGCDPKVFQGHNFCLADLWRVPRVDIIPDTSCLGVSGAVNMIDCKKSEAGDVEER